MFKNVLSISGKERYKLFFKSSDLLESYQRNKSGLKYYNPHASNQEIEETQIQFGKLKEYSSNYFTEACLSLHPYSISRYRRNPFFVLYMCSNHYFNEDIITDEETKRSWIYDVYSNEIKNCPYQLWDLKSVIIYLTLLKLTTAGEISHYYNAPYFVYDYLLNNGSCFENSYISDFIKNKNNLDKKELKYFPPPGDTFNLFDKYISQQSNYIDQRFLISDPEEIIKEINNIFKQSFISDQDMKFIYNSILNQEDEEIIYEALNKNIEKSNFSGDDPENIFGHYMKDFISSSTSITANEIRSYLEEIEDVPSDEIVEFKTKHGNFNILKKILEILSENYRGFSLINQNIVKKDIEEIYEDIESYAIYDINFNKININNINDIPSGLYAKTIEDITDEETGKLGKYLNVYYKTGDPRSLFRADLSKSISMLCRSMPPTSMINSVINILNNIPNLNDPKRKEYFYYNIQKNNMFNTILRFYSEYLELLYKVDYYYGSEAYKKKLDTFGENKDYIIPLIKEKLTTDEINTILYDKSNDNGSYQHIYEINPSEVYNIEVLDGLRKIRLVAQGELVDEKSALDFFNTYISKHNEKGNASHLSRVFEIFENSVGFNPEISNYFKGKSQSFKTISSKKGQEIFNDGINSNQIKTTKLSDYPNVIKSLDSVIKDFIDPKNYNADSKESIKASLESTPIYMVNRSWINNEMKNHGIDRIFEEIGIDDARGIFASYLETINDGKPFVVIYEDPLEKDEFEAVKDVYDIKDDEKYGQVIAHELIHRLQYLGVEGRRRMIANQNSSQNYGDPWLEKPNEIEAIVYGNIPYIYGLILQRINDLFDSGDKSLIDTLVEHLMEETKKVEAYQIDKIYDNIPPDSKQEMIIQNSEDKKSEEQTLKEYIKHSIYDVDIEKLNEEDKQTYVKEISDNLLQIVMTKWFSQFKVDYAAGLFFSNDSMAEKMALKIRNNFEQARREELSKMKPDEINNFTNELIDNPYQTHGRESLQRLVRDFPKNEQELFEKLKEEPLYIETIERITYYLNNKFNPEITGKDGDKYKYNVWFFDNGELKIPYSLDGLLNFIDSVDQIYPLYDNKEKFKELIKKYINERDKFKQVETYLQNSPEKETYESDEIHELVNLLVDMYSNYGSGWIWVAKKWDNIIKISKIKKEFLNTKWAADFY